MSYELELLLDGVSDWIGNLCYYATECEALKAGLTISTNSIRVREMRVVPRSNPVSHRFDTVINRTVAIDRQNKEAA